MVIFGIDPGVSGAISILENNKVLDAIEMPTIIDGKKNKRQVNGAQVVKIIKDQKYLDKEKIIIVEQVNAMPGQGVTSMFNFGQSFGVIKGISAALEISIYFVRPSKWKKHFDLLKTNKDASRTKAVQIYPYISDKLSRKKDSNKADAILIAKYFVDIQKAAKNI
jgi:crossover junction endodeoxyribonuclease RuvC